LAEHGYIIRRGYCHRDRRRGHARSSVAAASMRGPAAHAPTSGGPPSGCRSPRPGGIWCRS